MDLREALSQLDTLNDDHWTAEGAPKIDAVKEIVGGPVTRQDIINAAPHFTRENPIVEDEIKEDPVQPADGELPEDFFDAFAEQKPMDVNRFLGFLQTVPKEGLLELKDILDEQHKAVTDGRKDLEEMDRRLRQNLMYVKARIQNEIPDISDREANQAYIRKQQELRLQKHAAATALLKGVDPKMLDPRSVLDRAMARKTARGGKRPTYNPMKG